MKNILVNSLNGFAVSDIPMFIFQILVSLLLVRLLQLIWTKRFNVERSNHLLIVGLAFTFMAIMSKYSLPFAVLSLAVIIWMGKPENKSDNERLLYLVIGLIGIGIGSFNIVLTTIITLLMILIIWLFPNKDNA